MANMGDKLIKNGYVGGETIEYSNIKYSDKEYNYGEYIVRNKDSMFTPEIGSSSHKSKDERIASLNDEVKVEKNRANKFEAENIVLKLQTEKQKVELNDALQMIESMKIELEELRKESQERKNRFSRFDIMDI